MDDDFSKGVRLFVYTLSRYGSGPNVIWKKSSMLEKDEQKRYPVRPNILRDAGQRPS